MKQYVKIYCCGDCIQYNWRKHKCNLGAHVEGKPSDGFYQDCPLGLHEEDEILSSAEPERKKGKWVNGWRAISVCSECGYMLDFEGCNAGRGDANFCPNCGADMRDDHE